MIAQKRAREGKEEEKPWQDQFWALAGKRHLGEMAGGRQDTETNASARREIEAMKSGVEPMDDEEMEKKDHDSDGKESKKRRIQGPKQAYLATKPPESQWESKIEYRAIGKALGAGYDDVNSFFPSLYNPRSSVVIRHRDENNNNGNFSLSLFLDLPHLLTQPPHLPRPHPHRRQLPRFHHPRP